MGECYAERGMTDVADNAGWQTCLFIPGFCNFVVGDGTGGTEQFIMETATAAECVNTVLDAAVPRDPGVVQVILGGVEVGRRVHVHQMLERDHLVFRQPPVGPRRRLRPDTLGEEVAASTGGVSSLAAGRGQRADTWRGRLTLR